MSRIEGLVSDGTMPEPQQVQKLQQNTACSPCGQKERKNDFEFLKLYYKIYFDMLFGNRIFFFQPLTL